MPINSRNKGAVGERELVQALNDHGLLCRRTVQYCGNSGEAADVQCDGLPLHLEVKRTEKLKWRATLDQVRRDARGKPWVIFHRQSNMRWVVIIDMETWLADSVAVAHARMVRADIISKAMGGPVEGH